MDLLCKQIVRPRQFKVSTYCLVTHGHFHDLRLQCKVIVDDWGQAEDSQNGPLQMPGLLLDFDDIIEAQSKEKEEEDSPGAEDHQDVLDLTSDDTFDLDSDSSDPGRDFDREGFEEVVCLFFVIHLTG